MRAFKLTMALILCIATGISAQALEETSTTCSGTEMLSGKVFKEDSRKPLENVTVTAILLNKKEKFTYTDTDGEFGLEELKPGIYKIIFEKDGYRKVVKDKVTVRTNEPIKMIVEMEYLEYPLILSPFRFFLVD